MVTKTILSHVLVSTIILTICPYTLLIPLFSYLLYSSSITHNSVLYLQESVLTYFENKPKPSERQNLRRKSIELWFTNNYHILQNIVSQNSSA